MADVRCNSSRRSGRERGSARLGSAGSVAMTPPRSPALNRVPSSHLIKEVRHNILKHEIKSLDKTDLYFLS